MNKQVIFLAAAFCLCATNKAAAYDFSAINNGHVICYNITSSTPPLTVEVTGGQRYYSGNITIPNTVSYNGNTYSVTSIGDWTFYDCVGLTSVTIPNSVTFIGEYVFYVCTGLTSVTIPGSVTTIRNSAFEYCRDLTNIDVDANNTRYSSINGILFNKSQDTLIQYPVGKQGNYTIPNTVTTIDEAAFCSCIGLTSVTIGNSVTTIGDGAFYECTGLTSVTIPNAVTTIGYGAFGYCSSLTSVNFNATNCTFMGGDYYYSIFFGCFSVSALTIGNNVQTIPDYAFSGCTGLTSVTIPNSVKTIGSGVFRSCSNLTSVTIPNSVTNIGDHAFHSCFRLTSVTIGNLVTTIGAQAFNSCFRLTSVIIPNSVTTIGDKAFAYCRDLTSATIGNSVTTIGNGAFYECYSLTSVTIPNSVTTIGDWAFYQCHSITEAIIPDSVTTIGDYAFGACKGLTSVVIGNSVTTIGDYAFSSCDSLTSVIIGNSVTTIKDGAFIYCINLTSVTIPHAVTYIGEWAFYGCSGLKEIYVKAKTPPTVGTNAFEFVPNTIPVHVPCGATAAYQSAAVWSNFTNITEDILPVLSVQSNNTTMGTVSITQANTCADSTATIEAVANAGYQFVQWKDGNTENPRVITVTQDTIFTAMFDVEVGITELETAVAVIYPNPATDNIIISLREMITNAVFTLYDMQGKVLIRQAVSNEDVISVSEFAAGVYIYNVNTGKERYQGKIIVVNN
jgi:hypothetical protein